MYLLLYFLYITKVNANSNKKKLYQREVICWVLAEELREGLVPFIGEEIGHINKQVFGIFKERLSVRENIWLTLVREISDELLELSEDYVAASGGRLVLLRISAGAVRKLGLVAVVYGSFIPAGHLSQSSRLCRRTRRGSRVVVSAEAKGSENGGKILLRFGKWGIWNGGMVEIRGGYGGCVGGKDLAGKYYDA